MFFNHHNASEIMVQIEKNVTRGLTLDSEVALICAVVLCDMHRRIHLLFGDEFGICGHRIAENIPDAARILVEHEITKVVNKPGMFHMAGNPPACSKAISFNELPQALLFRHVNGGWIFESEYHYVWFDSSHTPTAIIQHPLTKGCSGKLI